MFLLLQIFGAGCLLIGAGAYLLLFLRRSSFSTPLDYACALSLSKTLNLRFAAAPTHPICWLKFFSHILLPYIGIGNLFLLAQITFKGITFTATAVFWSVACFSAVIDLLFIKFYDTVSFFIHLFTCLTGSIAPFLPLPIEAPFPLDFPIAVVCAAFWIYNLIYFFRRRILFFTPISNLLDTDLTLSSSESDDDVALSSSESDDDIEIEQPASAFIWNTNAVAAPPERSVVPLVEVETEIPTSPSARLDRMFLQNRSEERSTDLNQSIHEPCKGKEKPVAVSVRMAEKVKKVCPIPIKAPETAAEIRVEVAETTLFDRQKHLASCHIGQTVIIRRMPDRLHPHTIRIFALKRESVRVEIGSIQQELNTFICHLLPLGSEFHGIISSIQKGSDNLLHCEIRFCTSSNSNAVLTHTNDSCYRPLGK